MPSPESKKTVRTFAVASFLNDAGADMIYPIWPLFVTNVLGANMAVLGLIDGLSDAVVSISKAASGYLSDRLRRRKVFVWTGYLFGGVSRIGYAFSTTWGALIPFRILDRSGKIRSAPRDVIIAEVSERRERGSNFGFLRAMDNLGAVVGVLASIALVEVIGYRNLFLLAAIPSFIGVFLIIFFVKERRPNGAQLYTGFSIKNVGRDLKLFLVLSTIFELGAFSYSFLLVYAGEFGFRPLAVPILYLLFSVVASVASLPFGRLSDTIGRRAVIFFSFLFWICACITFIGMRSFTGIIMGFVLYGLHKGSLEPVQKAFVTELAPSDHRSTALGIFQMALGFAALPASFFAGVLWEKGGAALPFAASLVLSIVAAVLLFFVKEGAEEPRAEAA